MSDWEAVVGLEVHVRLNTRSKLFAPEPVVDDADANEGVGPVTLGLPGVLPTPNRRAVELALRAGLALGCEIQRRSEFARKNYFYPDMPKGYQISQHERPICLGGTVGFEVNGESHHCSLTRIHLEEDAGKSTHAADASLIDYNRAGVALIEVVGEPELASGEEAEAFLRALHEILCALGVTRGQLEKGHFRCDANVSVRRTGDTGLGIRTETKNLNSFRFVRDAVDAEIGRQIGILERGGRVARATRLYDGLTGAAATMRQKEVADDYRFFPDPDLPPLIVDDAWLSEIEAALPELPERRRERFARDYRLSSGDIAVLTGDPDLAALFEEAAAEGKGVDHAKRCANLLMGAPLAAAKGTDGGVAALTIDGTGLGTLARLQGEGLTATLAEQVLGHMLAGEGDPESIIADRGLAVVDDVDALEATIAAILAADPDNVARYRGGERKLFGYLMGSAMRALRGKGDAAQVRATLQRLLDRSD